VKPSIATSFRFSLSKADPLELDRRSKLWKRARVARRGESILMGLHGDSASLSAAFSSEPASGKTEHFAEVVHRTDRLAVVGDGHDALGHGVLGCGWPAILGPRSLHMAMCPTCPRRRRRTPRRSPRQDIPEFRVRKCDTADITQLWRGRATQWKERRKRCSDMDHLRGA
jgi:hypothetical protein